MWKILPFAFKNLLRNKRRTILTVLSISVSLFLLGVLLAVYAAFYHRPMPPGSALRLITRNKISLATILPQYYGERIAKIPGVKEVSIFNWFGGTYIDNRPEHMFGRFAVEPGKVFKILTEFEIPPDQLEAFQRDRQGFAVGKSIADRVGLKLGDRVTIVGDIYPITLELNVRAIFQGPDDNNTFFQWDYLQESLPQGWRGSVGTFNILCESEEAVPRVAREIDEMFRNSPQQTKTETESAFQLSFVNQLGNIKLFLLSIAGAVVFTILLVSGNTVAMSVRERIKEVGVLKTLGFTSPAVLALIVSESVFLAMLGGLVGVGGAYLVTQAMADIMVSFFSGFVLPLWGVPICVAVAVLIGFLSSIVPATIAARTTITDALRHTG